MHLTGCTKYFCQLVFMYSHYCGIAISLQLMTKYSFWATKNYMQWSFLIDISPIFFSICHLSVSSAAPLFSAELRDIHFITLTLLVHFDLSVLGRRVLDPTLGLFVWSFLQFLETTMRI